MLRYRLPGKLSCKKTGLCTSWTKYRQKFFYWSFPRVLVLEINGSPAKTFCVVFFRGESEWKYREDI